MLGWMYLRHLCMRQPIYEQAEKKFAEDANVTIEQVEEFLGRAEKDFFNNLGNEEE